MLICRLDAATHRTIRRDLRAEHRVVYALTDAVRHAEATGQRVLWRRDGRHLIIQGVPDLARVGGVEECVEYARPTPSAGDAVRIRLRASPRRAISKPGSRGVLVDLRGDDAIEWCRRKMGGAGLDVTDCAITSEGTMSGARRLAIGVVDFVVRAVVTDPAALAVARAAGVGPGKAWGMGLMVMHD